jgi:hypothetical protein
MFSLRKTLEQLEQLPLSEDSAAGSTPAEIAQYRAAYPHGHLPGDFDSRLGIRSLFPPGQTVRVSSLQNYLFQQSGTATAGGLTCTFRAFADGSGHWLLRLVWPAVNYEDELAAGFSFIFPGATGKHGFVATSEYIDISTNFEAFGTDTWIASNWVALFEKGVDFYLSTSVMASGEAFPVPGLIALQGPRPMEIAGGSYDGTTFLPDYGDYQPVSGLWGE